MIRKAITALLLLYPLSVGAQDFSALSRPGSVALMRHALAPGVGDPQNFDLSDCTTQRNLNDAGREQARRTGEALRAAEITFDKVWTSQWCRARDTATMMDVGPVTEVRALNSHFAGRGEPTSQSAKIREMLGALPKGTRVLLVTHQVNISALIGEFTASGEIIATTRQPDGSLTPTEKYRVAP